MHAVTEKNVFDKFSNIIVVGQRYDEFNFL